MNKYYQIVSYKSILSHHEGLEGHIFRCHEFVRGFSVSSRFWHFLLYRIYISYFYVQHNKECIIEKTYCSENLPPRLRRPARRTSSLAGESGLAQAGHPSLPSGPEALWAGGQRGVIPPFCKGRGGGIIRCYSFKQADTPPGAGYYYSASNRDEKI